MAMRVTWWWRENPEDVSRLREGIHGLWSSTNPANWIEKDTMRTFTHDLSGATAIGGHFELEREERLVVDGRELLYLVGKAHVDTACCGVGGCRYALVPGWIASWRQGRSEQGVPTSEVIPVEAEGAKARIRRAIEARETLNQVVFW
jgi:hypothetical protein